MYFFIYRTKSFKSLYLILSWLLNIFIYNKLNRCSIKCFQTITSMLNIQGDLRLNLFIILKCSDIGIGYYGGTCTFNCREFNTLVIECLFYSCKPS